MSFNYTQIGALINQDKFGEAAKQLVEVYVEVQFDEAREAGSPVEVKTNGAAVARKIAVNYRTVTRWIAVLLDRGHDVKKQAIAEIERRLKEKKAA